MTGPINPTLPTHDQAAWDTTLNTALTTIVNRVNTHADQHRFRGPYASKICKVFAAHVFEVS